MVPGRFNFCESVSAEGDLFLDLVCRIDRVFFVGEEVLDFKKASLEFYSRF